ncbi:MAG TPA: DUF5368 family protein [Aquamicrobium sp.]|nr:DUF5368 family protein [Aquamicrobium sp.]
MSDFNPVTLFFILSEGMGGWLWLLLAAGLLLLGGIVFGLSRLRRAGRPAKRPLIAATVMGTVATIVFTILAPRWTLTDTGAFASALDVAAAVMLALVPGVMVAALVFTMASLRCASRHKPAATLVAG